MKGNLFKISTLVALLTGLGITSLEAQNVSLSGRRNVITTAVPFLGIAPDARGGGMASTGVAAPPNANATYWNPATLGNVENDAELSASYTPWLRNLGIPDISLNYLSGYYRIDELSAIGGSLRYFSLGDIQFTDQNGNQLRTFRPNEFALSASYGRQLSENFSVGVSLRYIRSNLSGNTQTGGGTETQPGTAVSGDISAYYQTDVELFNTEADLAFGGNMRNLGSQISYTEVEGGDFIPMKLKLGSYLNFKLDEYNELAIMADFRKLLVPTPQPFDTTQGGSQGGGANVITPRGLNDKSVIEGAVESFSDAPGGFNEEMKEIKPSLGLEYWYDQQFALRAGYFYEAEEKGDRKYVTLGAGIRYNVLSLDFSYLISANGQPNQNSPLANTIRISLGLELNSTEKGS